MTYCYRDIKLEPYQIVNLEESSVSSRSDEGIITSLSSALADIQKVAKEHQVVPAVMATSQIITWFILMAKWVWWMLTWKKEVAIQLGV